MPILHLITYSLTFILFFFFIVVNCCLLIRKCKYVIRFHLCNLQIGNKQQMKEWNPDFLCYKIVLSSISLFHKNMPKLKQKFVTYKYKLKSKDN